MITQIFPLLLALSPNKCTDNPINATLGRVIDGDSLKATAHLKVEETDHLDIDIIVNVGITIRLADIDTPELRKPLQKSRAEAAKLFAETWVTSNRDAKLFTCGKGKYGRVIALVCPAAGGQCLGDALIIAGHEK